MTSKAWYILFAVSMTGCVGTDVGNPQDSTDGSELLIGTDPELETTVQGLTYRGIELDSAYVLVESVDLKADCENEGETLRTDGPFVVDLLAPTKTRIPLRDDGGEEFCQLRLHFSPTKDQSVPAGLAGHWLAVEGTLSDGSPFSITATRSERLQFVGRAAPISLEAGLLANLSLVNWIAENLDGLDEAVSLDDDTPGQLQNALRLEIRTRSRLYLDTDKNGKVDPDTPAPIALPEL